MDNGLQSAHAQGMWVGLEVPSDHYQISHSNGT